LDGDQNQNCFKLKNDEVNFIPRAEALELGCPVFPPVFALREAIKLQEKIGKENIRERILFLRRYFVDVMKKVEQFCEVANRNIKEENSSGIVILRLVRVKEEQVEPLLEQIVAKLKQENVFLSKRGTAIRVAIHYYNSTADLDLFLERIEKILRDIFLQNLTTKL